MPWARLKRPVPCVTSAMTSAVITPITAPVIPSSSWITIKASAVSMSGFSTRGTAEINLLGTNLIQRDEHRNGEYDGNKHCPGRFGICNEGHRQSNCDAPGGREALVLSEPFRQLGVADQSEGNSNNRRPEDPACYPLQQFCEDDQGEAGPKAENQGAQGDGHHPDRDQHPFRSHGIYELAAGHLTYQTGDAGYAEDKSDVLGGPLLGRQVGCGNGSKGGLHTGQKEVQPAQGKQALPRRCSGLLQGPRLSDTHRRPCLSSDKSIAGQPSRFFSNEPRCSKCRTCSICGPIRPTSRQLRV